MWWIKVVLGRQQALPDNWGMDVLNDALNATQQQQQHSKLDGRK
jgi:hypothetical protein